MSDAERDPGDRERLIKTGHPWLGARLLAHDLPRADFATLADLWQRTTATFECDLPKVWEGGHWMVHAVRGAWGRALGEDEDHRPEGLHAPPGCRRALFDDHVRIGANHVPSPYVIAVDRRRDRLIVQLSLFGFADKWRDEAFSAMAIALEDGVSIAPGSRTRAPWRIRRASWRRVVGIAEPAAPSHAYMVFTTPLADPQRDGSRFTAGKFLMGLVTRVKGLGRWHGLRIEPDNRTLKRWLEGVEVEEFAHSRWRATARRSSRSPGHVFIIEAADTALQIAGLPDELWPAMVLGQTCHAGQSTAFGYGRYTV